VCVHLYSLQWSEGGGSQVIAQKVGPPCDTALQRQFRSITLRRGQQRSSPPSPDAPKHAYVCVFKMNIHTQIFAGHTHAFPSYLAIEGEKKELLNVKTNRKRKTREKRSWKVLLETKKVPLSAPPVWRREGVNERSCCFCCWRVSWVLRWIVVESPCLFCCCFGAEIVTSFVSF
jgi:hypothetical protein